MSEETRLPSTDAPPSAEVKTEDVEMEQETMQEAQEKQPETLKRKYDDAAAKNGKSEPNGKSEANGVKLEGASTLTPVIVAPRAPQLEYIPLKTGLAYDVRMRYHAKIFTSYYEYIDPHPEDPRRIYRIYKILAEAGLINDPSLIGADDIGDLMLKIPVREATREEILQVHTPEHLDFIASTEKMDKEALLERTEKGDSVYFNHDSYMGAKLSCGGTIEACKAVVEGKVKNALAVVRPPGHHAEPNAPGGFCLFSNVAVAAKNILQNYPDSVRKIVVLDWDVHHGNGTQRAFFDDPRVLYISLHRYEQGKYYPGTTYGGADQVGEGPGAGFTVNIPWLVPGMGDGDYLYAFQKVVMPVCYEFAPDLVIISSGFDAAAGDIIGGCHVTPPGYGHMTHLMKGLARGNLCVVLEGGYNLDSISVSALAVAQTMVGEVPGELATTLPKPETIETIEEVIRIHAKYWKCLQPGHMAVALQSEKSLRLGDSLRTHQANTLFHNHQYITLPILESKFHATLEDQIVASPDIYDCQTIVISVHDPPEIWGLTDALSGTIDSINSVVVDPSQQVLEWAQARKYGVIDICVPLHCDDDYTYNPQLAGQELLLYVWDHYLQFFQASKIAFVGVGEAYSGIVHLLGHRDVRALVKASIGIVDKQPLRAIVPLIDENVTEWYFRNSLVFTSAKHPCWENANGDAIKKPRKKFGRVLKGDSVGMVDIFGERFDEGCDFILDAFEEFDSSDD
ncbi:hypothetical protein BABINDRAFT_159937 [Babjeviella inositovora NRRL Y-12698]|uniref:Histone deacetylase n=1 Tax=Babjeviella inositovora NRRL Y-12698 TaxID=984486 RepID=A0A1E3QVJ2_9ASCO|nr:uncharacterized protein BABINDRAFT_159937 [Babjeviella inositovora NRRL Y-12698]ODQ81679.1 hypothetical protein BABINDRAFT_159937 [Babjeviella inositovora NRRL Y-12698]